MPFFKRLISKNIEHVGSACNKLTYLDYLLKRIQVIVFARVLNHSLFGFFILIRAKKVGLFYAPIFASISQLNNLFKKIDSTFHLSYITYQELHQIHLQLI